MKLLVCDVEGTIFKPHISKDANHPSYIWAALAAHLGSKAEMEEKDTHKKWKNSEYGDPQNGESYMEWVKETIDIHKRNNLTKQGFDNVINAAEYYPGCVEFFHRLNRDQYIPILISGGIKQLSSRACRELNIIEDNSYTSCSYYFCDNKLDTDLSLINTSNFFGKHELVKVALRKYGLGDNDWLFIGDGINDVSVARVAPISIGISPLPELKEVVNFVFDDFSQLMQCNELIETQLLLQTTPIPFMSSDDYSIDSIKEYTKNKVNEQISNFSLNKLEDNAKNRVISLCGNDDRRIKGLTGIYQLLRAGEEVLFIYDKIINERKIVAATLQPFCCAAEIMVNICDIIFATDQQILKESNTYIAIKDKLKDKLDYFYSNDLAAVIIEYLKMRNISAHNYKRIPIEAAYAFAQRTYEIIQRLELICNGK